MGNLIKPNKLRLTVPQYKLPQSHQVPRSNISNKRIPMEVDPGSSFYRNKANFKYNDGFPQNRNINFSQPQAYVAKQQQNLPLQAVVFKRSREQSGSSQRPQPKAQRMNYMPEAMDGHCDEFDFNEYINEDNLFCNDNDHCDKSQIEVSDFNDEINF